MLKNFTLQNQNIKQSLCIKKCKCRSCIWVIEKYLQVCYMWKLQANNIVKTCKSSYTNTWLY